jgi:ssRNA-specific RNase YbeY (16S rRNA maturation enzyme)
MQMRTSANITEAFGEAMKVIPDIFVGFCSSDTQVPIGTKLAGVFETIAKVMMTVADVQAETAAIDLTEAGWQRRSVEWFHQTQVLPIEIQQIELQILGAHRRRDQAMQELNNQQRQIENATEVLDFLRDKFTATELYLCLQKETAALYRQMYELAHRTALQAQHAFNLERGHTARRFLPDRAWDDLHAGLLAGERLEAALHHMEMAYLNENVREYELTKHFSLRLQFPMAFLRLRATGRCEIDIPEWMFDLDYPGHYMRRIRDVKLTIPCVAGPYTGVHCRLTLLSSATRIEPRLAAPVHDCCCPPKRCDCETEEAARYRLCPDDPRMVKIFGARDAVTTSSGQNDSGLFELTFSDPRYLPFEFMGAVSRWRIELPPENNYFDPATLTDTVLHLDYTAREGGDLLRRAASAAAGGKLPGDGWSFFDVRHDFPDAWELFHRPVAHEGGRRDLTLQVRRKFFPYLPHNPPLRVTRLMLLFETADLPVRPPEPPCCCPEREAFGAHVVTFRAGTARAEASRDGSDVGRLICRAAAEWPRMYSGMIDIDILPFGRGRESCELCFGFPENVGEIVQTYLFCRYEPVSACASATPHDHDKGYERLQNRLNH